MKICKNVLIFLVITLLTINSGFAETKKQPKDKEIPMAIPEWRISEISATASKIKAKLLSLTGYILSYSFTYKGDFLGKIKNDLKEMDFLLIDAAKYYKMEKLAKLKKEKEMYEEIKQMSEEFSEMDEMIASNQFELIQKTYLSQQILNNINLPLSKMTNDENYIKLKPMSCEIDMLLKSILTKTLFFLKTGRDDMKSAVMKDRMRLYDDLTVYLKCARGIKFKEKPLMELDRTVTDVMRSAQDAIEDYDVIKSKINTYIDKINILTDLLDTDIQKLVLPKEKKLEEE